MNRAELPSLVLLLQVVLCLACCPSSLCRAGCPTSLKHGRCTQHITLLTGPSRNGFSDTVHDAVIVAPWLLAEVCREACAQPSSESRSLSKEYLNGHLKNGSLFWGGKTIKISPIADKKMSPQVKQNNFQPHREHLGGPDWQILRLLHPVHNTWSLQEPCHPQSCALTTSYTLSELRGAFSSPAALNGPVLWAAMAALLCFPSGPSVSSSKGVSSCGYSCSKPHMLKLGSFSFPAEAPGSVACSANSLVGRAASSSGAK